MRPVEHAMVFDRPPHVTIRPHVAFSATKSGRRGPVQARDPISAITMRDSRQSGFGVGSSSSGGAAAPERERKRRSSDEWDTLTTMDAAGPPLHRASTTTATHGQPSSSSLHTHHSHGQPSWGRPSWGSGWMADRGPPAGRWSATPAVMSGGGAGEVQRGRAPAPAAAAPMSRWGPSRGWGVAQGLLSHRGDYHPDKSPRRTTKRRVGDGYDEQDGEGEDGSRGDDMALIWGGGVHLDHDDEASATARDDGGRTKRRMGGDGDCRVALALRPQLLSACLLEQSGLVELALTELDRLVLCADRTDPAEAATHATHCEDLGAVAIADRLLRWAVRTNLSRVPSDAPEWLELAKHCLETQQVHCANAVLSELAPHISLSPTIQELHRVFELQVGVAPSAACSLLRDADSGVCGVLVYLGASAVEWRAGNVESAARILEHGIEQSPHAPKLWYALGALRRHTEGRTAALATYRAGLEACPGSGTLHRLVTSPLECTVDGERVAEADGMHVELGFDECHM